MFLSLFICKHLSLDLQNNEQYGFQKAYLALNKTRIVLIPLEILILISIRHGVISEASL